MHSKFLVILSVAFIGCALFALYSYTELEVVVPDNGIVGLHADNLAIESVTVDGEPAEFEVFPHYLHLDNGDRWCSVSSASSAADAAGSVYLSSLQRELVPNLLIMCTKSVKSDSEQQGQALLENGVQSSSEPKQVSVVLVVLAVLFVEHHAVFICCLCFGFML